MRFCTPNSPPRPPTWPQKGSQIHLLGLQNRPKIDQNESWEGSGEGYRKKVDFRSQILPPRPPKCSQKGTKMDPQIDQNVVKKALFFVFVFGHVFNHFLMIFGMKKTPFLELISLKKHVDSKHVGFQKSLKSIEKHKLFLMFTKLKI